MNYTESDSAYEALEKMSVREILQNINREDQSVAFAVQKAIPQIESFVEQLVPKIQDSGRLFYIGAGTSGRLGILDASECPPTYGVPHGLVVGIIAGGDGAIRKAVEFAEDDTQAAWKDLQNHQINSKDTVVGIAASGKTPYVLGGLQKCQENQITTACIVCNPKSPIAQHAHFPIEVIVGAEFVTGSTRMKAGTAQKLVLNMISTSLMIRLGKVKGNKMLDMKPSNHKLVDRAVRMLAQEAQISTEQALELVQKYGSVRNALENWKKN